jgi:hypothetical protein
MTDARTFAVGALIAIFTFPSPELFYVNWQYKYFQQLYWLLSTRMLTDNTNICNNFTDFLARVRNLRRL